FNLTLFPSISQAQALKKLEQIRQYIRRSIKYISLILIPTVTIISITATDLISFVYSKRFIPGSQPLAIIILGNTFLAYFLLCTTILIAVGKPKIPLFFLCLTLPLAIILNLNFIPRYQLIGASLATSISHLTGLIISAVYIMKYFNIYPSGKSIFSIFVGINSIIVFSYILPFSNFFLLPKYVILFLIYGAIMFIFKELTLEDANIIKQIFYKTKTN
ncbi:MAG: polysaccharide biosynthesis C-terminal domain-containing protein, partial [bacterium]